MLDRDPPRSPLALFLFEHNSRSGLLNGFNQPYLLPPPPLFGGLGVVVWTVDQLCTNTWCDMHLMSGGVIKTQYPAHAGARPHTHFLIS